MSAAAWLAQRAAELTGHQGEARLAAEGPHCQAIEGFLGGGGWGLGTACVPNHTATARQPTESSHHLQAAPASTSAACPTSRRPPPGKYAAGPSTTRMRRSNLTAPTAHRRRCSPPAGTEPEEASQAAPPAPASSTEANDSEQEPAAGGGEGAAPPPQLEDAPPAPAPPVEAALRAYVQPPAEHAGLPAVHFMRRGAQLLHTAAEAEAAVTYVALPEGPTVDSLRQVRD